MRNKLATALLIIFSVILLIQFSFIYGLPDWTFTKDSYVIANKLILYCSIFVLIICLLVLFKTSKFLILLLGIVFLIFLGIVAYFEFNPIDTTTQSIDKEMLWMSLDGKKLIVRQSINTKTNSVILDTVLVRDFGIFRKIYPREFSLHTTILTDTQLPLKK